MENTGQRHLNLREIACDTMRNAKHFLIWLVWIVAFALLYGAVWSRFPYAFPAPPQTLSDWIASHISGIEEEEDTVDLLLFSYSIIASIGVTLTGWFAIKLFRKHHAKKPA